MVSLVLVAVFIGSHAQGGSARGQGNTRCRIAFNHEDARDGPTIDIYSVNADGTHLLALTNDGHSHGAQWSPNGREIAYIHDSAWPSGLLEPKIYIADKRWLSRTFAELYVMNSDGGNAHALRDMGGPLVAAGWSPDGQRILCITKHYLPGRAESDEPDERDELYVMDGDGRHMQSLRTFDAPVFDAAWSPDRETLAVYKGTSPNVDQGPTNGLFLMPVHGKGEIGPIAIPPTTLTWSPDGTKLALRVFAREQNAYAALGEVNADGSHLTQITDPERLEIAFGPVWAPNGRQLAFSAVTKDSRSWMGDRQVFIMNVDGSGLRQLTHDSDWNCASPTWAPDGSELAFSCQFKSPPCHPVGGPSCGEPGPECIRRIFVLSMTEPNAKPIQVTQVDGTAPVFAPFQ